MRDIRRLDALEPVVERLTTLRVAETGTAVFPTIMDLLIFSAGIGIASERRTPVPSSGKAVPYRIFENQQKEGYIYMIALADMKKPAALEPENEDEVARIFEEYAAGGLGVISSWLNENALDSGGVQTLFAKLQAEFSLSDSMVQDPSPV